MLGADGLPARGALGPRAEATVEAGHASVVTGFRAQAMERDGGQFVLVAEHGRPKHPLGRRQAHRGPVPGAGPPLTCEVGHVRQCGLWSVILDGVASRAGS